MAKYSDITLEIDLGAVVNNYKYLQNIASGVVCAAVVKANCYGLGISEIPKALYKNGCRDFFVATLDEAIELKKVFRVQSSEFSQANIYVFHGVKKGEEEEFEYQNLIPVLNDFYQLEVWSKFSALKKKCQGAILHFDTGMNRLGFDYQDAEKIKNSKSLESLKVKYVMSHLSCISVKEHALNKAQLERVKKIQSIFSDIPVSFANSRGIISGKDYHFDMVRSGSYLYGIAGSSDQKINQVATLKAKILQIRNVKENGFVGYCGLSEVKKGARLAIVPLGYADGYHRILTGNAAAFYKGYRLPLMGRVSMDMTIWDISAIPESEIDIGNEIELMGKNITVDELANRAQTIGYEILTGLGRRYRTKYV